MLTLLTLNYVKTNTWAEWLKKQICFQQNNFIKIPFGTLIFYIT